MMQHQLQHLLLPSFSTMTDLFRSHGHGGICFARKHIRGLKAREFSWHLRASVTLLGSEKVYLGTPSTIPKLYVLS